jgi:hypothetical protein
VKGKRVPKFGDRMFNRWAGERNPQRRGIFVREVRVRRGRLNAGVWWELTDGEGKFWQVDPEALEIEEGS